MLKNVLAHSIRSPRMLFLVPFFLYVALYVVVMFKGVFIRGDDFAYVESILQSLALGRLETHDWIGPFNAFFTLTGVIAYLLTHNFYFSTYGVLALFAFANFWLLFMCFKQRLNLLQSAWLTFLVVTFPFYFHKSLDYHGCIPTLTCFLITLLCFEKRHYRWMFVAIFLAVSTRQNSLFLFLLPTYLGFESYRKDKKIPWMLGVYTIICLGALVLLRLQMNTNWFQRSFHPFSKILNNPFAILHQFGAGIFLGIFFLTITNLFVRGGNTFSLLKENLKNYFLPLGFTVIFLWVAFGSPAALVWFQTPLIGSLDHHGKLQLILKLMVLLSFWFFDRKLFKWSPYFFLAVGYVAISCQLGFFWDYYLAELALLALWIALRALPPHSQHLIHFPNQFRIVLALVFMVNLGYAYLYKIQLDKMALSNFVFEKLEREGKVSPQRMTGATFGFLGYKLCGLLAEENPHYEHDDFSCYVQGNGVVIESALPWRQKLKTGENQESTVLDSGTFSVGFLPLPYRVVDHHNPEGRDICHGKFILNPKTIKHSRTYPLNNEEWRKWIRASRKPGVR